MKLYEYVTNADVIKAPMGYDPLYLTIDDDTMEPAAGGFNVCGRYTIYGKPFDCFIRVKHPAGKPRTAQVYKYDPSYHVETI